MSSWEEQADAATSDSKSLRFNPGAPSFAFNPSASSFAPNSANATSKSQEDSASGNDSKTEENVAATDNNEKHSSNEAEEAVESKPNDSADEKHESKANDSRDESTTEYDSDASGANTPRSTSTDASLAEKQALMEKMKVTGGDSRPHMNVVFIGHVDAGKSTMSGQILYSTGHVDKRTIEKYEREAKALNRESWFLAFIMDTNEEERAKGKTVEVGRAHFQTDNRRFTILDAPGHKSYVPNMIQGAAQADVGVLVISARVNEFETGFDRGGQTREHALLARTLGVQHLVVVVNKMDDSSVEWGKDRYEEITKRLGPFLKKSGFKRKSVHFVPISALTGHNIKDKVPSSVASWYEGPTLLDVLDNIEIENRNPDSPLRIPILDKYSERGTVVLGKVETGTLRVGQKVMVYPGAHKATVESITIGDSADDTVDIALPGENVEVRIKGVNDDLVRKGFVLADREHPVPVTTRFQAQLQVLELEHRLFAAGYKAVLHLHTCEEEVTADKLVKLMDPKSGKVVENPKFVKSNQACVCNFSVPQSVCIEKYENMPQLGRFTIRDEERTVAIGKVVGLPRNVLETAKQL